MNSQRRQQGFTIIELMIATAVFSVILLLCTAGLIQVGRLYQRGITESQTQEAARTVIDEISQAIQLSGEGVYGPSANNYCVGNKNYSFHLGKQVSDSTLDTDRGLIVTSANCDASTPVNWSGEELLGKNMRLTKFSITGSNNVYTVTARVVYGDDDLLNPDGGPYVGDVTCKLESGRQFCATSELSVTVQRRIN
jgi:prepilin-type N-terminal cleavage/methylation domain-containing protein